MQSKRKFACILLSLCCALSFLLSACAENKPGTVTTAEITQAPNTTNSVNPAETQSPVGPGDSAFTYTVDDRGVTLTAYVGSEAQPEIPTQLEGLPVVAIGPECFQGLICLERLRIPEGVTSIGDYTFESCGRLQKVYFPATLETIGEGAFSGCASLSLVDLQEGLRSIGRGAFLYCGDLSTLDIPASVTEIGDFAFAGCTGLLGVVFRGEKLERLPDRCFLGDDHLVKVKLPGQIDQLGQRAFYGCAALEQLYFAEPVAQVGQDAFGECGRAANISIQTPILTKNLFSGCAALNYVQLSQAQKLEYGAFTGTGVESLDLPAGLKEIEEGAFLNSKVRALTLDEANEYYSLADGVLYTDEGKTLLAWFPQDPYAEEAQTSFTVPEGVEAIASYAFSGAPLQEIHLSSTLREIRKDAFLDCGAALLDAPAGLELPEPPAQEESAGEEETPAAPETAPDTIGSLAGEKNLFKEEDFADFKEIPNEEFETWSETYLAANAGNLETKYIPYTMAYKGEAVPHFMGMTAVQNHDPVMWADAANAFGEDFEQMYRMMNHGLFTELRRGKMCDNLILYSGLYDSQLMAAAGTETVPDTQQLIDAIGSTFSDPVMISTTTDPTVAANFGDTLFYIYASKDAMESLGAISIDSLLHTNEKEILMSERALYKILDVGNMAIDTEDDEGNPTTVYRAYVKVQLLGPTAE